MPHNMLLLAGYNSFIMMNGLHFDIHLAPHEPFHISKYITEWASQLTMFRQNDLLTADAMLDFAKQCGNPAGGDDSESVNDYTNHGWLVPDETNHAARPMYHPFRIYPLHKAMTAARLKPPPWVSLHPERFDTVIGGMKRSNEKIAKIDAEAHGRNEVAALAILLEPLYWPDITGWRARIDDLDDAEYITAIDEHRAKAHALVATLDPVTWNGLHWHLRKDAAALDPNESLYLLLRLAHWEERKALQGHIRGALWLRHMAEVLRRAFEEVHKVQWLEEDQFHSRWIPEGRAVAYGFVRPLDEEDRSRPYIAFNYGLITGSVVKWYVEGPTEYYAIQQALQNLEKNHVELVNLKGNIADGRSNENIALKLIAALEEDKKCRRFSMLSFDLDEVNNVKFFSKQVKDNRVVGYITANNPDFEFSNFTCKELAEVAAGIDEQQGFSGDPIRLADWSGIETGKAFEEKYKQVSAKRGMSLKGKEWGEALADYASRLPYRPDTNILRPFCHEIKVALCGTTASYDLHAQRFGFNSLTFDLVDLWEGKPKPSPWL